jgi:Rod binding domain-containing protein
MRPVGPVDKTAASPEESAQRSELDRVAKDFESIFVRQLLAASRFGETNGQNGFGSMVVDALATSVTEGGGIGLAQRIAEALDAADKPRSPGQESPT